MIRPAIACAVAIAATPALACNPTIDRIDASCYADVSSALAVALATDTPLWLPHGTYPVSAPLVVDYSAFSTQGFQIISDGAILDGRSIPDAPVMRIECQADCFYFHITGTLTVYANTAAAAVRFGKNDFSDAHNSAKIDHMVINNAGTGRGARLNYVLNADLSLYSVTAGDYGMQLNQVQFSRINGAASATAGAALEIGGGYTFANTFQGIDLEASQTCLAIDSQYANRNTFVSPYFNCRVPVAATAGNNNLLLNPSYGASAPPNLQSQVGVASIP
jgi:hypothetical protein